MENNEERRRSYRKEMKKRKKKNHQDELIKRVPQPQAQHACQILTSRFQTRDAVNHYACCYVTKEKRKGKREREREGKSSTWRKFKENCLNTTTKK